MYKTKKIAMFDVDGVIYDGHTIFDEIQNQEKRKIIATGTWNKILLELEAYKSGKKNYKQAADSMLKIHAYSLEDCFYTDLVDDTFRFLSQNKNKFFPYFKKLVPKLKITHDIYFVTTNFQFICEALGKLFGVCNYLSSIAEVKKGKFTGDVKLSLGGNKGIVSELIERYGKVGSIAVGDSENDADMLNKVEFPFVMEPNDKLKKIALEKGWQIVNRNIISKKILSQIN